MDLDQKDLVLLEEDDGPETISLPPNLESLVIQECKSLTSIQEFPNTLESLNIYKCESLTSIPTLKNTRLQDLFLENCPKLRETLVLPATIERLAIILCPLVNLQNLPTMLKELTCSLDQFEQWCTNVLFLSSMSTLINNPFFQISRPRKRHTFKERNKFLEIYEKYINSFRDTMSALEIPLHSHANPNNLLVRAFNIGEIRENVLGNLSRLSNTDNRELIARTINKAYRGSQNITDPNLKLGGKTKRSTRKKRKYTKKRRKNTKK
jgi:hypothetical protein